MSGKLRNVEMSQVIGSTQSVMLSEPRVQRRNRARTGRLPACNASRTRLSSTWLGSPSDSVAASLAVGKAHQSAPMMRGAGMSRES